MAELKSDGGAQGAYETAVDQTGATVITLTGEIDVSNVEQLRAAMDPVLSGRPDRLVFDLGELHFMDSSGIALLLESAERAGDVVLRRPSDIIRRVIVSTGLTDILPMSD
jgi:anti-sigma B factor antagonist